MAGSSWALRHRFPRHRQSHPDQSPLARTPQPRPHEERGTTRHHRVSTRPRSPRTPPYHTVSSSSRTPMPRPRSPAPIVERRDDYVGRTSSPALGAFVRSDTSPGWPMPDKWSSRDAADTERRCANKCDKWSSRDAADTERRGCGPAPPPRSHELESAPRPHNLQIARLGLGSGGSRAQSFHVPRHT